MIEIMQGAVARGMLSWRKWGFTYCLFSIFIISGSCYAEQSNDAEKRSQLIALSLKNSRNPQYLDSLAQKLLEYEDQECKARGYFLKGLGATYKGNIDSALYNYQQSIALIPEGGKYDSRFTYSMVMKNVGIAHYRQNQYSEGDSVFNRMADIALAKGDSLAYASSLSNLGNALSVRRDFKGAIEKYKKAILIEEKLGSKGVASTYLKIGTIFGRMSQEEEALIWFRKAQLRIPARDLRLKGRLNNNMAVAWRSLGDLDSAQYYLNKALTIHQATGSLIDQAMALENLARNELALKNFSAADSILKDAYKLLPEGTKVQNYSLSRLWMLSLDLALERNETAKAESLMRSLELADVQIQSELDYLRLKARYFEQVGAKDSAIYYLKELQAKEQALNKQNDASKIKQEANEVELAEIRRKEKEAEEESIFRYWLVAFLLIFIALVVFYFTRRL
jgi:tetratricopeptide (TPR) repeat protein